MKRWLSALILTTPLTAVPAFAEGKADTNKKMEEPAHFAPEVTLQEFQTIVKNKSATIIDANSTDTYNKGHVPGAVNFAKNEENLAKVLPADKSTLIVAYCGGPLCTAWQDPATKAKKLGYTNIKHFKGGIKGWKEAGMSVEAVN